jgi:hypothetical protein
MSALRYRGICAVALYTKTWRPGERDGVLLGRREYPSMKKVKRSEASAVKHLAPLETELFRDYMSLIEHVAMLQYDDGEARESGWFTVRTTGAAWQLLVKDPDSACSFCVTAKTVDEAFMTAALLLGCDEAPWEPDTYLAASKARSKKK